MLISKKLVRITFAGVLTFGSISAAQQALCDGPDQSPMSVEGIVGVFCVTDQACAGQDGACPGPQTGLPFGASCGKVASGVLGCKPNAAAPRAAASSTAAATTTDNGTLVIEIEIDDSEDARSLDASV
ncbi:hypothetical protein Gpo141_00006872 [Globisporangium polare]